MNLRRFFSWLLCICFMLSPIHSLAWASTGYSTPSNASVATASDAEYDELYSSLLSYSSVPLASASDADYGIMLLGSETPNIQNVSNTVDRSDVRFEIQYVDAHDVTHYIGDDLASDGYARVDKPSDFSSMVRYCVRIGENSLPSTGNYKIEVGYRGDVGGVYNPYAVSLMYGDKYKNAVTLYPGSERIYDFDYYMGDIYFAYNVQITGDDLIVFFYSDDTVLWPFAGTWNIRFTKLASGENADFSNPYYSSTETQDSIANSSIEISQNTADINDTLKEIITHISDQLAALWDQMYNYMHLGQLANDNNNTAQIVGSIEEQMENDNDNTEQVTSAIEEHGNFIIEGLKSLFIPSDEYFKSWFDDMYAFFNDRLGFLMLPLDVLMEFIDIFTSSSDEFAGIPFPEFKWIDGTVVIPAQTVGFDFLNTDWGKELQNKVYFVGNVIMIGALFVLIQGKMKEVTEQ